ncbi:hypothetical protein GQ600_9070 [Phytophthora cactorum]|nr:hypothetical protein GQ600_9070 [Phytophthora cactorum]
MRTVFNSYGANRTFSDFGRFFWMRNAWFRGPHDRLMAFRKILEVAAVFDAPRFATTLNPADTPCVDRITDTVNARLKRDYTLGRD